MIKTEQDTKDYIKQNNVFEFRNNFSWMTLLDGITHALPNAHARVKKYKLQDAIQERNAVDSLIYDVIYVFNEDGIRQPLDNPNASEVAIFFGDSIAFGEGNYTDATIPTLFQLENSKYQCFNYGFMAHAASHMLVRVMSESFTKKFEYTGGRVFYLYRDDTIKITTGNVPWREYSPIITYDTDNVKPAGFWKDEDIDEPLPSQYEEEDYKLTADTFKEIQKQLYKINPYLELHIVFLPLTFTTEKMKTMIGDIKYTDLSLFDMSHRTNQYDLFLDGSFTMPANKIIADNLKSENKYNIEHEDFLSDLEFIGYMLPAHNEFPYDDAGVLLAQLIRRYGTEGDFMVDLKSLWEKKLLLLEHITSDTTKEQLKELCEPMRRNKNLLDIFYQEYIQ